MTGVQRTLGLVLVVTVVASIGLPIVGIGSFHATDVIGTMPPWSEATPYDFRPDNGLVTDTVNGVVPARAAFRDRVWSGDLPMWDPLRGPGEPLGVIPNVGTFSPLTLPWLVAPLWLAPVLTKLLETGVAVVGMFLLCRAWGLRRTSSLVGALAFVNSAFLVVWTNWPQAAVGALVPLLLWAVERGVTAPTWRRSWPVGAVVAVMWLAGFPSVTAYALLVAGAYALVRVAAAGHRARQAVARLVALAAAVAVGTALAAVQLLPFLSFLDSLELAGRARVAGVPLPWTQLATLAVPDVFGNPAERASYGPTNYVEGQSWVGVVVLVLVALLVVGRRRVAAPRGLLPFLAAVGGLGVFLVYLDTPLLEAFGQIPLLGTNNIGRFRAVLGVVMAGAAALGYESLVTEERRGRFGTRRTLVALGIVAMVTVPLVGVAVGQAIEAGRLVYVVAQLVLPLGIGILTAVVLLADAGGWEVDPRQVRRAVLVVGLLVVGAGVVVLGSGVLGREATGVAPSSVRLFVRSSLATLVIGTVAAGVVVTLLVRGAGRPGRRAAVALALPVLLAAEAVAFANPWYARTPSELWFPATATHAFLADELGGDRFAAAGSTLYSSTNGVYGLRSVTSHSFMPPTYREYLLAIEPDAFSRSSTFPMFAADASTATSPLLDRAAARFWAVGPTDPLLGRDGPSLVGSGGLELSSGEAVVAPIGPAVQLRGVTLRLVDHEGLAGMPAITVTVVDQDGAVVAAGSTRLHWWIEPGPLPVAVPQVDVPPGSAIRVGLQGATAGTVKLAADGVRPAYDAVVAGDDALRLAHVDGAVLYERTDALPRIRWAGRSVVEEDGSRRLARLADGVAPDVVVLGAGGDEDAVAGAAELDVLQDAGDVVEVRVAAEDAGWLVVADGIQTAWRAELDGQPVDVVAADHAFGAVAVPAGTHEVRLWYHPAGWTAGQALSLAAALTLVAWAVLDRRDRRRGRRTPVPADGPVSRGS